MAFNRIRFLVIGLCAHYIECWIVSKVKGMNQLQAEIELNVAELILDCRSQLRYIAFMS